MRNIIGLCGVKTSGKTTAFEIIKNELPDAQEVQLAKKLKDVCSYVYKIPRSWFDDQDYKENILQFPVYISKPSLMDIYEMFNWESYMESSDTKSDIEQHVERLNNQYNRFLYTPRQVAQYIGTEVLRSIHPDIHCLEATRDLSKDGTFIVTDMRFPNEYGFFTKFDSVFHPYYIKRDIAEKEALKDKHPSEQLIMETGKKCKLIDNNGSLVTFEDRLKSEITKLGL